MITETGRIILSYLLAQDNTSISSKNLADLCNLSLSTIRNEINWLNEGLVPYGLHIDTKQSQGCRLVINDPQLDSQPLEQLKYDLKRKLFNNKSKSYRSDYIIRRLLITSGYISQEKLSEELFFSPSTVTRSLALAQQSLKRYNLEIKLKKNRGLYISGDEFNKRIQMLIQHKKFMHLDPIKQAQEQAFANYFLTNTDHYKLIKSTLIEILSRYGSLEFSFINIPKLVNYLILSKQRHTYTKEISFTQQQLDIIYSENAYQAAKEIFHSFSSFFDFTPDEKDYCSFARLLLGYRSLSSLKMIPQTKQKRVFEEGYCILSELIQRENLNLELFTPDIYEQFACNIASMRLRQIMETPYDMESFYPFYGVSGLSADFCVTLSKILEEKFAMSFDQTYTQSNLYLFDRIFDQANKSSMNLNIQVISLYGIEYARNVAGYLGRKYNRYIHSINAIEFSCIDQYDLNQFDLVLTDLSSNHLSGKNVLSIDFSNGTTLCSDFEKHLRYLVTQNMSARLSNSIYQTKFKSKIEAFQFIADQYKQDNTFKEQFIDDLIQRDICYSSERKNSLAFISTYSETLPASTLMIMINHSEFEWNNSKIKYLVFYYRNRENQSEIYTFSRILKNLLEKSPSELDELFQDPDHIIHSLSPKRFA